MKKLLLLLGFASIIMNAQIPSYVPTNGLVGYWPFSGNANDISGNGNNGIINGATLTSDRFGNNSCYNFNVNNWSWGAGGDKIYIPFNSTFNSEKITVSAWFMKTSNGTQNQSLNIINRYQFGYNNPNGQTWQIALPNGDNSPLWTSVIQASNQNNQQVISAIGSKIALNTWYNVVFTFDGQELKQYINGVFITSNNLVGFKLNTNGNSGISIGVSDQANGHWSPFGGKIDDIGIWNRALSQEEITNLYNTNQCITTITVTDMLIINVGQLSYINPVTWANNIAISPNPASTQININFNNITNLNGGTLKIINSLGQQVATTQITTSGTNSTMQLATWGGAGMYFVQIINPQGQIVDIKKILLQ